mgnify:CR=1 FL=1
MIPCKVHLVTFCYPLDYLENIGIPLGLFMEITDLDQVLFLLGVTVLPRFFVLYVFVDCEFSKFT